MTRSRPRANGGGAGQGQEVPGLARTIGVGELSELLDRGAGVTVLDIRPAGERAEWFVPGSIHHDAYARLRAGDPAALDGVTPPAGIPVVTVCASGVTSEAAARLLARRGFDARSLAGGMKAWSLAWNTAELAAPEALLV